MQTLQRAPISASLRDWLKSQNVAGLVGAHVYVGGLPTGTTGSSIELFRVGGITDGPVDRPLIQFNVRASTGSVCEQIVAALLELLESTGPTALSAGLVFMGVASVAAPIWSPDLPGDTPRYVLTVEVAVKALS